jgi:hypothetical protein
MQCDERDLLEVLKFELNFLKDGGYGRSPRTPWRPSYIFEDSPTCLNYDAKENRASCSECVLMHLVPLERRLAKIPCRHIPLNASGETLDSLYRCGNQREIEEAVASWLKETIVRLEEERNAVQQVRRKHPLASGELMKGTPLYQSLHPKCANPACSAAFHWTVGGKFLRFRPDPADLPNERPALDSATGTHGVRHYWLCERCCQAFTLVFHPEHGVVLKELWPELAEQPEAHKPEAHNKASAA